MAGLSKDESEDLIAQSEDAGLRADFQKMRENSETLAAKASFEDHLLWLDQVSSGLGHPRRENKPIIGTEWTL